MAVLHWKTPNGNEGSLLTEQLFYNNSSNKTLAGIKTFRDDNSLYYYGFSSSDGTSLTNLIGFRSTPHGTDRLDVRCKQLCFGREKAEFDDDNIGSAIALSEDQNDTVNWVNSNIAITAANGTTHSNLWISYTDKFAKWKDKHISPLYDSTKKWIKMHNKLIQWGTSAGTANGATTVTFPVAFSSAPRVLVLPRNTNKDAVQQITHVESRTTSQFVLRSMRSTYSGATAAYNGWGVSWVAIGHCAAGYPS